MSAHSHKEIDFQIMWNRLIAVVGEQAQVLIRTAFSPIVRECEDISAGIFDLKGRMIAQAVTGTPGHVNSMAESVGHFLRHFPISTMKEGDAYITNDPWMGTGHLNDFVITTPAFHKGRLVGLFSCTSHLMDIGGLGNGPEATDVFMEGLSIPMLKLIDQGQVNETLMAMIRANTRLPVDTEGDTYSLAACNDVGVRALCDMMDEFRLDTLDPLADFIIERSRQAVLDKIAALPQGSWSHEMTIDGYNTPLTLKAKLTVSEGRVSVSYDGSPPTVGRGINVPMAYTRAYTVFGLACAISPDVPNNAGSLAPYHVEAPEGSVLNAPRPAPRLVPPCHRTDAARHGVRMPAHAPACPGPGGRDVLPVEHCRPWPVVPQRIGDLPDYALAITTNGGTGARPGLNGLSATAFPSGVHGTPIEIAEIQCPLIFWEKELRENSGGLGQTKGGDGQIMRIGTTQKQPFELLAAFDRVDHPARGALGGQDGAAGRVETASGRKLAGKGLQVLKPDEVLVLMTPGGGGLGAV
ncbi:N-methylhydantoinase B [Gluconobacter oxydans 621H]|uniref:N-methylhydantoinase B n=1 Tax=Gluconobacter oxydans (strain 621H) TaxID=290633 RepID=Q5FUE0_GLUOX|nr:hydantoinase B/oxoprolinase family protein [Gluconobacter oxydans]AAW60006.1 N-methylhydantoinase B [Gluconobacter oxydans 621H]